MPDRHESQPSQALAAHLRPIAALVWVVVAAVAPLGWFAAGLDAQCTAGRHLAAQVAALVQREGPVLPRLWRYDTQKLSNQINTLRAESGALEVRLEDSGGLALAVPAGDNGALAAPWLAWTYQAAAAPTKTEIWVAMDLRPLWRTSGALAGAFGTLAVALAGLILGLPLRAVRRSESEIGVLVGQLQQSRAALAELAGELEARVADRSARLESALADLRAHEVHLRDLAGQALRLQESERRAIARDLHDDIGQVLTGVRLQIQVLAASNQPAADVTRGANRLLGALDSAIDQTRSAVRRLAPPLLAEQGLAAALRQTCAALTSPLGPAIDCKTEALPALDSAVETAIFRIAQEALTNAVRHSGATAIRVTVGHGSSQGSEPGPATLWLQVQDDGTGFDPHQPSSGHGLGGMRDRAELLGGRLQVLTSAGGGCTIRAELPCSPPTVDDSQGRPA